MMNESKRKCSLVEDMISIAVESFHQKHQFIGRSQWKNRTFLLRQFEFSCNLNQTNAHAIVDLHANTLLTAYLIFASVDE